MLKNLLKGLSSKKTDSKKEDNEATLVNRNLPERPKQVSVASTKAPTSGSNTKTLIFRGVLVALIIGLGVSEYIKPPEETAAKNNGEEGTVVSKKTRPRPAPAPEVTAEAPATAPTPETATSATPKTPEVALNPAPTDTSTTSPVANSAEVTAPVAPTEAVAQVTAPNGEASTEKPIEAAAPAVVEQIPAVNALPGTTPVTPPTETIVESAPSLDLKPTEVVSEVPKEVKEASTDLKLAEVSKPSPVSEADAPPAPSPAPNVAMAKPSSVPSVGEDLKKDKLQLTEEASKSDDFLRLLNENTRSVSQESETKSKVEYTTPPNYERLGRGLVYNCVDKHYACLDRESYFRCKANREWSNENSKKPSCVELEVYQSENDCSTIQQSRINKVVEVPQCVDKK